MGNRYWGLSLSGGGVLGFAHIGVLMALEQNGLRPHLLSGTSAGAIVAGLYGAGVDFMGIRKSLEILTQVEAGFMPTSAPITLPSTDSVPATALKGIIPGTIVETTLDTLAKGKYMADVEVALAITAVDVETGEEVIFTNAAKVPKVEPGYRKSWAENGKKVFLFDVKLAEAIRASISLPGLFIPKNLEGRSLVDGGIRNMVPVDELRRMGAEEIVAVDLGLHAERPQKADNFVSVLSRCFSLACRRDTLRSLHKYASVILQPEVFDVGFPSPGKIQALIELGKICAEENMNRLLSLLN